jgi:hypothetical protein
LFGHSFATHSVAYITKSIVKPVLWYLPVYLYGSSYATKRIDQLQHVAPIRVTNITNTSNTIYKPDTLSVLNQDIPIRTSISVGVQIANKGGLFWIETKIQYSQINNNLWNSAGYSIVDVTNILDNNSWVAQIQRVCPNKIPVFYAVYRLNSKLPVGIITNTALWGSNADCLKNREYIVLPLWHYILTWLFSG